MDLMHSCIALLIGFLFGNIPNGYLYARSQGHDIFKEGSGNPGSTNVLRTMGKKAGATVLLMDIAKTVFPIFLLTLLWRVESPGLRAQLSLVTGFGAILGHDFTVVPKLKGGKGVACTGALLLVFDFRLALLLLAVFIGIVLISGYVSLGSIIGVSLFFLSVLLFGRSGWLPVTEQTYFSCTLLSFLIAALCIFQHRANIQRLLHGRENRFGHKK